MITWQPPQAPTHMGVFKLRAGYREARVSAAAGESKRDGKRVGQRARFSVLNRRG